MHMHILRVLLLCISTKSSWDLFSLHLSIIRLSIIRFLTALLISRRTPFLLHFAQEIFVTLLRYYGVFPCRLCSRNACYVITLLRGLSLPALLKKCLLRYYVITGSFLAGFAQEMLVTLLRYYGVFPCRLCSRNACYVITLLRGLSLPALLKKCLLRYYAITTIFRCWLCSRNVCHVITLLRGLSLPALLKKCLLRYY